MKHTSKPTILVISTTLISLLGVGTATASLLPNGIGRDWQDWVLNRANPLQGILAEVKGTHPILDQAMDTALGNVWDELQTADGTVPNPYDVRASREANSSALSNNSVVGQRDVANLYDQEVARSMAASRLGEDGDEWATAEAEDLAELVESSQEGVSHIQQLANNAQGLSVTQDVMKAQAEMNGAIASLMAQQTQLSVDNHTSLMQLQRLQSILAQLAANTSEGIDESNRRARVERHLQITGSAQAPIYIPGILGTESDREAPEDEDS